MGVADFAELVMAAQERIDHNGIEVLAALLANYGDIFDSVEAGEVTQRAVAAIVSGTLKEDPLSGHVFVFCNRRRNRVKILFWDSSGFWVCAKRLERGTFVWPEGGELSYEMSSEELAVLLAGVDLRGARRRRWYERA